MTGGSKHTRAPHLASGLLALLGAAAFAQTEFEGEVSGVWTVDGSPYIQTGAANVQQGQSLTIRPGVEVILHRQQPFLIDGRLTAIGTEEDTIRFHQPDSVVAGSLILNTGEDTVRFEFCRFDSLIVAIGMRDDTFLEVQNCYFFENSYAVESRPIWVSVTNSTFVSRDPDGKVFLGWNRGLGSYDRASVLFSDNRLIGRIEARFQCREGLAERNTGEALQVGNNLRRPTLLFRECRRVFVRENIDIGITTDNLNRALQEAVVERNRSDRPITYLNAGNARVVCRDNVAGSITFNNARNADATGNIVAGFGCTGNSRLTATRNLGLFGLSGANNIVTLVNNTIVNVDRGRANSVITWSGMDSAGNRLTLRNNIVGSLYGQDRAVDSRIAISGGGYNYFGNVGEVYGARENLLPNDQVGNPRQRGGFPFDYRLRADSPCIDAGDPNSPHDPDGTRADIGCFPFDQENGEPPALDRRWDYYIGWNETFRYVARAVDEGEELLIEFEGLPEWLEVEQRRDLVRDSLVVSGVVPEGQEDFVFRVIARDDREHEDTLSVRVMVYPYRVLTGVVRGTLDIEQSPFIVADTAWVPAGDSLVLPPGTRLYFDNRNDGLAGRAKSMLMLMGSIKAVGTARDSIFIATVDSTGTQRVLGFAANPQNFSEYAFCNFSNISSDYTNYNCNIMLRNSTLSNSWLSAHGSTMRTVVSNNMGGGVYILGKGSVLGNAKVSMNFTLPDSIHIHNNDSISAFVWFGQPGIRDEAQILVNNNSFKGGFRTRAYHDVGNDTVIVRNNVFSESSIGVSLIGSNYMNITNNIFCTNRERALELYPFDRLTFIYNNMVKDANIAIYTWYGNNFDERFRANLRIENNVFADVDTLLYSYRNRTGGIRFNSFFDFTVISNDTSFDPRITQTNANGDSVDSHFNLYLDPRIASPDSLDFRLYADSPLIDAGNPDSTFNDVDGTVNDIGLFGGPFGTSYEYLEPNEVISFAGPPREFRVGQAYPNPFNLASNISVEVPYYGETTFSLHDVTGRRIGRHTIHLTAGVHRRTLSDFLNRDIGQFQSGLYVLTVEFEKQRQTRKLVLIK